MTPAQFASYIRSKTRTNADTFKDAEILLYANVTKDEIAKEVIKANEDYFGIELLRDLKDGVRKYLFPTYMLSQMKYLQAKLDGVNWSTLEEFDITSYDRPTDEDSIRANWAGRKPAFDIFGGELSIYSENAIIAVSGGLKLWSIVFPADLTSLSGAVDMSVNPSKTEFGMPRQLHKVWATKVIIEYKSSKEKPIPLTEQELKVEVDLQSAINSLKLQNLDRSVVANVPDNSNNGENY